MSYCRFSTDDFQCDVYCYESDFGFQIYVATNRCVFDEPLPPKVELTEKNIKAWLARDNKVSEMVRKAQSSDATHPRIGLPCDGQSFCVETASEAADKLRELKGMGYNVPDDAIAELEAEAKEPSP